MTDTLTDPVVLAATGSAPHQGRVRFESGIPGFPDAREFELVRSDGALFELVSRDVAGPGFVVVDAAALSTHYQPVLDDAVVARLALRDAEEALVLIIVTVGDGITTAYGNLFAPVVVNTRTRQAAQVVLAGQGYPLRAPLAAALAEVPPAG